MKWNARLTGIALLVAVTLAGMPSAQAGGQQVVTMERLLDEMTNLEWLTHAAPPGERGFQFSSYDRNSKIINGERIDWFANVDRGYYLREENTERGLEYVMADYEGPGAIVRIWSANAGAGIWRIYLDGNTEPVIEGVGRKLLAGKDKNFGPAFAEKRNMGYNLIFPIPFQKSCKVTLSPWRNKEKKQRVGTYYHINIRAFPAGTTVETFRLEMLDEFASKIEQVAKELENPSIKAPSQPLEKTFSFKISPGEKSTLMELNGPAAIYGMELDIEVEDEKENMDKALQKCVFTAEWDNEARPAIWSPLGAFFGTSPGLNPFVSVPLEMRKAAKGATLLSRWVMPFKKSARLNVENNSDIPVSLKGRVVYCPREWGRDSLYFHAGYRQEDFYPTRPLSDWTVLDARGGSGRLAGIMMSIRHPDPDTWWGEGDEKIYVDGEEFPSTFGTGTEDYFGYAWGTDWKTFYHAYHGVTKKIDANIFSMAFHALFPSGSKKIEADPKKGESCSQYRFQVIDNIPFEQSLLFDMEIWHWTQTITVDLQAVTYWYAEPGVKDDIRKIEKEELACW